jgi:RNA polymerase sigma-70 factor (ECF subfamily)
MQTDARLLGRIVKQDETAFDTLYNRYHDSVLRLARRIIRRADAAEDIVQEVFLRVWQKSGQWNGRGSVKGWILRIATNLSLNHLEVYRRKAQHQILYNPRDDENDVLSRVADTLNAGPEETLHQQERLRFLEKSMAELSEEKREVLKILLSEDVTLRNISERLDLPIGTVKSRIHYASRDLREKLSNNEEKEKV